MPIQLEEVPRKRPTVSKEDVGQLLVKAREIIASEIEPEDKGDVLTHEPSVSHPFPLSQSQESTFESVKKLQTELGVLVNSGPGQDATKLESEDSQKGIPHPLPPTASQELHKSVETSQGPEILVDSRQDQINKELESEDSHKLAVKSERQGNQASSIRG